MNMHTLIKKGVAGMLMLAIVFGGLNIQNGFSIKPKEAQAQWAVVVVGNTSPTELLNTANNTQNTVNIYLDKIKNWILDGLAWHIAKMFVQRITASVVQWINSGFSGSPSFLTNPGGFFADLGDQVTGNFIANTGILSGLCSPFNVDIRLSLALGQAGYGQVEKYTCTLSSVISNVKNSTVNGATIGGFMKGDFKQGGWPAFIEISRPTNNISGAYLKAHSDLLQKVGEKQGAKQQQLIQGSGFLSWDSCTNIDEGEATDIVETYGTDESVSGLYKAQDAAGQIKAAGGVSELTGNSAFSKTLNTGGNTSVQASIDPKTGNMSYKDCHTETPGSVINSQLSKSLGSGVDQLNLADSINEIVDALIGQLINQVLQSGLASVSSKPSGVTQSYIQQLSDAANSTSTYANDSSNIQDALATYAKNAQKEIGYHQDAVAAFEVARGDFRTAETCALAIPYNSLTNGDAIAALLTSIAQASSSMAAAEKPYSDKLVAAQTALDSVNTDAENMSELSSPEDAQAASDQLKAYITNNSPVLDVVALKAEVDQAEKTADSYSKQAKEYLNQCHAIPTY